MTTLAHLAAEAAARGETLKANRRGGFAAVPMAAHPTIQRIRAAMYSHPNLQRAFEFALESEQERRDAEAESIEREAVRLLDTLMDMPVRHALPLLRIHEQDALHLALADTAERLARMPK